MLLWFECQEGTVLRVRFVCCEGFLVQAEVGKGRSVFLVFRDLYR